MSLFSSKMGRPAKKLTDRKGVSRLGNLQNNGSESTGHTGMLLSESRIKVFMFHFYICNFFYIIFQGNLMMIVKILWQLQTMPEMLAVRHL